MDISISGSLEGDLGIEKMINNLKKIDGKAVEAGIFGGFEQKKAVWQEYGTSRGIPSRPFLRNALYENESRFASFILPYLQNVLEGGSADGVFDALGPFMAMSIQRSIASGGFAALAPSTIKKKGHSKPLLDTGAMYGAVTWKKV
jgi:Bacteriophage protein of unknown function (DUF646).